MLMPLLMYGIILLGFFICREEVKQYIPGNILLTMAIASLLIVGMLMLLIKSEKMQKKKVR